MKSLWTCRRTFLGFVGILALTWIACCKGLDTSFAIAMIAGAVAASNAYQKRGYEVGPGQPVEGER